MLLLRAFLALALLLESVSEKFDPYVAQRSLNDEGFKRADDRCSLSNSTDGDILDRLVLDFSPKKHLKIFCGTYTKADTLKYGGIRAIRNSWAKKCDGWIAFSPSKNDSSVPFVSLPMQGVEDYFNMWQKVRAIWKYIGQNYIDDFDWFFLSGDDTFVVMENLRGYLASDSVQAKVAEGKGCFLGRRMFLDASHVFNSGGAGYILDRASLRLLTSSIVSADKSCSPMERTNTEDVKVSECLAAKGIFPIDTRDEHLTERYVAFLYCVDSSVLDTHFIVLCNVRRFHPFPPGWHLRYQRGRTPWYQLFSSFS